MAQQLIHLLFKIGHQAFIKTLHLNQEVFNLRQELIRLQINHTEAIRLKMEIKILKVDLLLREILEICYEKTKTSFAFSLCNTQSAFSFIKLSHSVEFLFLIVNYLTLIKERGLLFH